MIELTRLSKTFDGNPPTEALRDATLSIRDGEWLSIVGPSGAGKTTLLNLIGLLETPTAGSYVLDGVDIGSIKANKRAELRAQRFGFIFQMFHLVGTRSVLGNIELGMVYASVPRGTRNERAREAAANVGLAHRVEAEVATLSGGEKQRVAIARAIASQADIYLCDEPTGNLDAKSGFLVLDEIKKAHDHGVTVVMVSHDDDVAAFGDRVVEVVDGQVSAGGPA